MQSSIQSSLQEHTDKSSQAIITYKLLAEATQRELALLSQNCANSAALQEQVIEHREEKATLKEQLQQKELSLMQSTCKEDNLRYKLDDRLAEIETHRKELETLRLKSQDAPDIQVRIAELYAKIRDKEADHEKAASRVEELERKEAQSKVEHERLTSHLANMQLKMEEAKASTQQLIDAKAQYQETLKAEQIKVLAGASSASEERLLQLRRKWENDEKHLKYDVEMAQKRVTQLEHEAKNIDRLNDSDDVMVCACCLFVDDSYGVDACTG